MHQICDNNLFGLLIGAIGTNGENAIGLSANIKLAIGAYRRKQLYAGR